MSDTTYTLIALRYDDNDFIDESGLSRSELIDRLTDLEAADKYDRYNQVYWFQEPEEYDYSIGAEVGSKVANRKRELADAKILKDKQAKEAHQVLQDAADRATYERLREKFGDPIDRSS